MDLEGPSYAPLSCGKAVYLVVLLHGYGSVGEDLINVALNWQPELPKAEFLAANAPFPCEFAARGRQWFSIQDRSPAKLLAGVRAAGEILDGFLDELLAKRRLDDSHLALVGFSQGAMMALYVGMRRRKRIGGVVAFSGSLHGADVLGAEIVNRPPVLLVHGDADEIVPFERMAKAHAALEAAAVPVRSVRRPGLGHSIDDDGVILAGDFLREVLMTKTAGAGQDAH
jgi:phospholipase/carboxylesterase